MHADISAGNGTILLDQDEPAKAVEMPVNTAQKKSESVIKLAKMKIRVTLDRNDVTNITLHSYQQRIEIRRRLLLYEERVNVERERHRQMVRDSTQKKIKMLVDRIQLENSKGVAHPIKALHDENEFYENKRRLREIYELFMADRVKYKPCKYRTKLVKMVKICEPHSWTTKPAAKLWKRKTYKVYTREKNWDQTRSKPFPSQYRCQFCHRSMKDAKKESEWFLSAYDLGITFIVSFYFNRCICEKHYTTFYR